MPTVENYYIDPDTGGSPARDYASLSAFESDKQQDLVTNDKQINALCRSTSGSSDGGGGKLDFAGWTDDATRYCEVRGIESHGGKWNASNWRFIPASWNQQAAIASFDANQGYMRFINLQIKANHDNGDGLAVGGNPSSSDCRIERCIVRGNANAGSGQGCYADRINSYFSNNIVYDFGGEAFNQNWAGWTMVAYNNTVHNSANGFYIGNGTMTVKNCVADGCTDGFNVGAGAWGSGSDYNASDIASDAPGSNSQNGTGTTFVDEANDDFHLSTSDTVCLDNGTDLSGDSTYAISVDNENTTRTGTWDIGAHQAAAAATRRIFVVS